MVLSNESMSSAASAAGRQLLLEGCYTDLEGILRKINAVTLDEVREAAALITDPKTVALAVVGETHTLEFYENMLEKLNV